MPKMKQLAWMLAAGWLIFAPPAAAANRKAEKFLQQGKQAEARGDYDAALELYERALALDPSDAAYLLHVRRARFAASQRHVDLGQKLRREGRLEEALAEFQKAFAIDPGSTIAEQELRRTNQMIEREKRRQARPGEPAPPPEERGLTEGELARREAQRRAARLLAMPELKPANRRIAGLKIVNQPARVLYETVGKLAGINVLFDAEFQDARRYTIDLNHSTLEEALNYISLLTKTFYKPLSSNTIFVTQDNPTKRRDYEEYVTRIFYLQNAYNNQELTEIMTAMRTVTEVRRVFPVNSQYAIVVRGTADQVALAEKILLDLDKPKPEVVVDVLVMEANRTRTRDLALTPLSSGRPGLGSPVNFTGGGTSGAVPLNRVRDLGTGDWSVVVPSFLVPGAAERPSDPGADDAAGAGGGRPEGDAAAGRPLSVCHRLVPAGHGGRRRVAVHLDAVPVRRGRHQRRSDAARARRGDLAPGGVRDLQHPRPGGRRRPVAAGDRAAQGDAHHPGARRR